MEAAAPDALADVEMTVVGVGPGPLEDGDPAPLLEEQAPIVTSTPIVPATNTTRWITS